MHPPPHGSWEELRIKTEFLVNTCTRGPSWCVHTRHLLTGSRSALGTETSLTPRCPALVSGPGLSLNWFRAGLKGLPWP